jgi:hypothetical protein
MILFMNTECLTVSLPQKSIVFISNYKSKHKVKSNSQVILEALELLEQKACTTFLGKWVKHIMMPLCNSRKQPLRTS